MSPDWSATPQAVPYADLSDPQTLNLYSYVRNNPLSRNDPDGHCGLVGDAPCSLGQFFASLGDRIQGGLKGEANVILDMTVAGKYTRRFQPSNAEQADAMSNVQEVAPLMQTGLAMAIPGPKGIKAEVLADEALVVRGGLNKAENFANGSGVTLDSNGKLQGVSVQSATGKSVAELSQGMPHNQVGVTTVGEVRAAGGNVTPSGTTPNPNHCTLCGVTPHKASELMRVIPNPAKKLPEQ